MPETLAISAMVLKHAKPHVTHDGCTFEQIDDFKVTEVVYRDEQGNSRGLDTKRMPDAGIAELRRGLTHSTNPAAVMLDYLHTLKEIYGPSRNSCLRMLPSSLSRVERMRLRSRFRGDERHPTWPF